MLLVRLLLKKAPKWLNPLLWGLVALRLIFPFGIESELSLIPDAEPINPSFLNNQYWDEAAALDDSSFWYGMQGVQQNSMNAQDGETLRNYRANSISAVSSGPSLRGILKAILPAMSLIWVIGMAVLLLYIAISYFLLYRRVSMAVLLHDNIYECEFVSSPFVLGVIRPRIYLPSGMPESDAVHVIAHERAHIKRHDHWVKPIAFILLSVYWFNPLMWIAYFLLSHDIELACDEKIIKHLALPERADYSETLLNYSIKRKTIAACPLAFGEVGVKERIKNVLSYKKPTFWIIIAALLACAALAVCFLTNPKPKVPAPFERGYSADGVIGESWTTVLEERDEDDWQRLIFRNAESAPTADMDIGSINYYLDADGLLHARAYAQDELVELGLLEEFSMDDVELCVAEFMKGRFIKSNESLNLNLNSSNLNAVDNSRPVFRRFINKIYSDMEHDLGRPNPLIGFSINGMAYADGCDWDWIISQNKRAWRINPQFYIGEDARGLYLLEQKDGSYLTINELYEYYPSSLDEYGEVSWIYNCLITSIKVNRDITKRGFAPMKLRELIGLVERGNITWDDLKGYAYGDVFDYPLFMSMRASSYYPDELRAYRIGDDFLLILDGGIKSNLFGSGPDFDMPPKMELYWGNIDEEGAEHMDHIDLSDENALDFIKERRHRRVHQIMTQRELVRLAESPEGITWDELNRFAGNTIGKTSYFTVLGKGGKGSFQLTAAGEADDAPSSVQLVCYLPYETCDVLTEDVEAFMNARLNGGIAAYRSIDCDDVFDEAHGSHFEFTLCDNGRYFIRHCGTFERSEGGTYKQKGKRCILTDAEGLTLVFDIEDDLYILDTEASTNMELLGDLDENLLFKRSEDEP